MSQTYYAILTAIGEAKLANAAALNTTLKIAKMAVGDGGGVVPTPNRSQTALVGEWYRAGLNTLAVDPSNTSQIIAELVIPEATGGNWIREMGLIDADGNLIAVANTPPSYKPQLAEGSGRTQVLRMVLIVSSASAVELKIDPSVVLATRQYVDDAITVAVNRLDNKQSVRVATTANLPLTGTPTVDGIALAVGDRILVKNQDTASQNGLYLIAAGTWNRALDADASSEVTPGLTVYVEQGTAQADTIWKLITDAPITLGNTALVFADITSGYAPLRSPELITPRRTATPARSITSKELADLTYVEQSIGNRNLYSGQIKASVVIPTKMNGAIFQMCAESIVEVTMPSAAASQAGDTLRFFSNSSYAYTLKSAINNESIELPLLGPLKTLTLLAGESVELCTTDKVNWLVTGGSLAAKLSQKTTMSAFRAYNSQTQNISAYTNTKLLFGAELFDFQNEYSTTNGTFTASHDGFYEFSGAIHGDPSNSSQALRCLTLWVNGSERVRLQENTYSSNQTTIMGSTGPIKLTAGDIVSLYYYTSLADKTFANETMSWFAGRRIL